MSIDIPTALTEVEAVALTQLAAGKRVLEVGSLLGFSTVTMARVAEHVTSIDPHEGYPVDNPRPTWPLFNGNLEHFGVADQVTAFKADDSMLLAYEVLEDGEEAFEFAFIDATGTYEDTIRIIERVVDVMHVDAPILAVHDYGIAAWPGAGEAVRDYCTQNLLNFGVVDTLALIRLGHPDD